MENISEANHKILSRYFLDENKITYILNIINEERIHQFIIGRFSSEPILVCTTKKNIYFIDLKHTIKLRKQDISNAIFKQGLPDGECEIQTDNMKYVITNIIDGRVFDFIQDINPKQINHANYDNTSRMEFHELLNPDHAEEIDKLRKWQQEGHISHYEYDDFNPSISKAGK